MNEVIRQTAGYRSKKIDFCPSRWLRLIIVSAILGAFSVAANGAEISFGDQEQFDAMQAAGLSFEGIRFGSTYFDNNFSRLILDGDPSDVISGLSWSANKFVVSDGEACTYLPVYDRFWFSSWPLVNYSGLSDCVVYSERANFAGNTITVRRFYWSQLTSKGNRVLLGADIAFNGTLIFNFNNAGVARVDRDSLASCIEESPQSFPQELSEDAKKQLCFQATMAFRNDVIKLPNTNDDVFPGMGDDFVDGGGGFDRAEMSRPFKSYVVNKINNGAGFQLFNGYGSYDVLQNIELIRFSDGTEIDDTYQGFWGLFCPMSWRIPVYLSESKFSATQSCLVNHGNNTGTTQNVWRFFNTRDRAFFYTASREEAHMVHWRSQPDTSSSGYIFPVGGTALQYQQESDWPYVAQGTTFAAANRIIDAAVPLWRFYNYETGHHFFTVSSEERDMVKGKSETGEWPFNFEGKAFSVYSEDLSLAYVIPVYRLYSPKFNRHFFSASEIEIQLMLETGEWNDEGVGFWAEDPCFSNEDDDVQDEEFMFSGDCSR